MHRKRNYRICSLALWAMLCATGCAGTETTGDVSSSEPELPPLVTSVSEAQTEPATEAVTETTVTDTPEALYQDETVTQWKLPEELGSLQAIRYHDGCLYLLGVQQTEEQPAEHALYCAEVADEPVFSQLLSNADSEDLQGLMDFAVLSDGSICGLICENANSLPYDDPDFDPDTFDWESYYETYVTQYRLAWYRPDGSVTRKMGLSTLLDLDEEARQTMSFTGIQCDSADQIFLTATIDETETLMTLDGNGNLCAIQGKNSNWLSLETSYQWIRCGSDGMLLLEQNAQDEIVLSHLVVTDGVLWKTPITAPLQITAETMLAEEETESGWYGFWDTTGIYRVMGKNEEAVLLYTWKDLGYSFDDIREVLLLSEEKLFFTAYSAQGELSLQYVSNGIPESEPESKLPSESSETSQPAIATSVTQPE